MTKVNEQERSGNQYVVFTIDHQLCALSIEEVVEIVRIHEITEVPGIHDYISGLINLRGTIIPVINVRTRYQISPITFVKKSRIVIVHDEGENIGIIVDEVKMVTYVEEENVEPTLDMFDSLEKDNFLGFANIQNSLVGILNLKKVLYPEESLEEV